MTTVTLKIPHRYVWLIDNMLFMEENSVDIYLSQGGQEFQFYAYFTITKAILSCIRTAILDQEQCNSLLTISLAIAFYHHIPFLLLSNICNFFSEMFTTFSKNISFLPRQAARYFLVSLAEKKLNGAITLYTKVSPVFSTSVTKYA